LGLAFHVLLDAQVSDGIGFQQFGKAALIADEFLVQRGRERIELVDANFTFLRDLLPFLRGDTG
jgi:hypothetical protein